MADESFDPAFNARLRQLMAAAPGRVWINSGRRSRQRQMALWNAALAKYGSAAAARKWVAPPGKSKHEEGIAADLGYESPAVKRWVHENAAKFGLHFPLGNEPWHIEPAGSRGAAKPRTITATATSADKRAQTASGQPQQPVQPTEDPRSVEYQLRSFASILMTPEPTSTSEPAEVA